MVPRGKLYQKANATSCTNAKMYHKKMVPKPFIPKANGTLAICTKRKWYFNQLYQRGNGTSSKSYIFSK